MNWKTHIEIVKNETNNICVMCIIFPLVCLNSIKIEWECSCNKKQNNHIYDFGECYVGEVCTPMEEYAVWNRQKKARRKQKPCQKQTPQSKVKIKYVPNQEKQKQKQIQKKNNYSLTNNCIEFVQMQWNTDPRWENIKMFEHNAISRQNESKLKQWQLFAAIDVPNRQNRRDSLCNCFIINSWWKLWEN